ncbi:MAG: hypothetical protein ACI33S_03210 [Bacilli bacterium]
MSDNISLIDEETEALISSLIGYSSDIEKSLFDMSKTISKLVSILEGEISSNINAKFNEYESKFPFINENTQSYIKDFKNLVSAFINQDKATSSGDVVTAVKGGDLVNVKY